MSTRTQTHARKKLSFRADTAPARRLAEYKRFLRLENEMIHMRHRGGESGLRVTRARSNLIDVILQKLLATALEPYSAKGKTPEIALVATGGYGRAELCPLSDIDVMILHPPGLKGEPLKRVQQRINDEVVMMLYDIGLTVGPTFRSISEAFAEARADIQTKTALLEARFIAGTEATFRSFETAYRTFYRKENPKAYIEARLADQAQRRAQVGGTVFLQEPDIKRGVGGLRDYQNALWMARVKLGAESMKDLCERKYLRPGELRDMNRAYNFLLRVRNQLHFDSPKATNLLHLEKQPQIAKKLGYDDPDPLERVEAFMRDYYRNAQVIYRTSVILEHRLALTSEATKPRKLSFRDVIQSRRRTPAKRLDGFILRGRELAAESEDVFEVDPVRLIRVFRHCQQLDAHLEFDLSTLIRDSLPKITKHVTNSPEANRSFRAILEDVGNVFPTLSRMHELGVLGRFIPDWDGLTCLVQHEHYHRYTADVHTLNTMKELDEVFSDPSPTHEGYLRVLREASRPSLLYPALLLHDIGKGQSIEDHAAIGEAMAKPILARLGFERSQSETVGFLIKNHLEMARFWQKFDLDEPETTQAFADIVEDEDRLRFLYVLTFCDARATASSLWNSYKDTLHTTLFRNTFRFLQDGKAVGEKMAKRVEMIKADLMGKIIPDVTEEEVAAHFSLLPERYFIQTDNDEISLHLQMVNRLLKSIITTDTLSSLQPMIDWRDDLDLSLTAVNVVTWDRAGLFYKIAGAFALAGLNILTAKVISRADHIAIDTFYVAEPGRGIVQNQSVMDQFQRHLHAALISNKDLYPEIAGQARKNQNRFFSATGNPLLKSFTPRVEVYHELSLKRTILEIQAPDRVGLLYQVSKVIFDHGFDITFARINTERGLAIDTFYIETPENEEVSDSPRLMELRDSITNIVTPETSEKEAVDY